MRSIGKAKTAMARRRVVLLGDGYANHGHGVAPSVNAMAQFSFEWTGTAKEWQYCDRKASEQRSRAGRGQCLAKELSSSA